MPSLKNISIFKQTFVGIDAGSFINRTAQACETLPAITTMTTISLKDFVITGRFGQIGLGVTKEDVVNFLGKPNSDIDYGNAGGAVVYGWYEFFYRKETQTISGIQNDHLMTWPMNKAKMIRNHKESIFFQNDKFSIDIWFLNPGQDITYREVIDILNREQIDFERVNDKFRGHFIKFNSGVTMDFDISARDYIDEKEKVDLDHQVLNGIRLFDIG